MHSFNFYSGLLSNKKMKEKAEVERLDLKDRYKAKPFQRLQLQFSQKVLLVEKFLSHIQVLWKILRIFSLIQYSRQLLESSVLILN